MPTSIFFAGRVIYTPGSYSQVDASGLESVGLGAAGIVAVLGTAEGGKPVSAISEFRDIPRFNTPEKMAKAFRSGQLREVGDMLFAPAKDPDILAGAQEVLTMKVNPSTQSTGFLKAGVDNQIDLTSRDYGAFTTSINVDVQAGSTKGKALTIRFEDVVETVDNLGGDGMGTLSYDGGTRGYNTALMSVNAAGDITVQATRTSAGQDGDLVTPGDHPLVASVVEVLAATQTGAVASITSVDALAGTVTLTGLTGMTVLHEGHLMTVTGAATGANNGTFLIKERLSATSVKLVNAAAVAPDANNGAISWLVTETGIGQKITIYGLSGGLPVKETLTLTGATVAAGTVVWDSQGVAGAVISGATTVTTVTLRVVSAGATIFTFAAGVMDQGVVVGEYCYVNNTTISVVLSAAGAHQVLVFGKNASGTPIAEAMTTNGTTPVVSTVNTFASIDVVTLTNVPAGLTFTLSAQAAKTLATVQTTLKKVSDYFASKQAILVNPAPPPTNLIRGFDFQFGTGSLSFAVKDLDIQVNTDIKGPVVGKLTADLYAIVAWINQNSQLVSAAESAASYTVPDNTPAPIFLGVQAGSQSGVEGVALFSHYQAALNLLKKGRVNSVVDLSGDPAVAAALDAHCAYMGGIGRSERDGFVGLLNAGMTDVPTKDEIKRQVIDINSRHIRAVGQAVERFNSAGERVEYLPPFLGAILAGAQAGSPVGTSLTFKYMNLLALRQHSSWNPTDDSEEMIQAGLCFLENKEGVGRRVVRNITTHLSTNNIAFSEGSVNAAVNFAVFNFRTNMEFAVGKRGFAGTLAAARGVAVGTLGLLVDNVIITAYRSLFIELVVDVMDVSVEIAPVIPINFVRTTVHLVTIKQAA